MPKRRRVVIVVCVDEPVDAHDELLELLPTAYAVALRLRGSGADDDQIAAALGIERDAVFNILVIAEHKLDELRQLGPHDIT